MHNPMMCANGHSYEEANTQHWLSNNNKSPLTNLRFEHKTLTPNHNLQNAIEIWVEEVNAKKRSEAEAEEERVEAQRIEGERERLAAEEEAARGEGCVNQGGETGRRGSGGGGRGSKSGGSAN
jgi:hypothetical protein